MTVTAISDDAFESEVISANTPVLIDFWAPWCGPCKALSPLLEDISGNYEGKVRFVKMDVDQNPSTPAKFGVRGIPTLIIFKGGKVEKTQVGLLSKEELIKLVDSVL